MALQRKLITLKGHTPVQFLIVEYDLDSSSPLKRAGDPMSENQCRAWLKQRGFEEIEIMEKIEKALSTPV